MQIRQNNRDQLKTISIEKSQLKDIEQWKNNEWIVTNGIGGFASSTVTGMNTRRYHGLLVAPLNPPVQRIMTVSSLDETVIIGDKTFELSTHQYDDIIHPTGYSYLEKFEFLYHPFFYYKIGDVEITKSIWLEHNRNIVFVRYKMIRGNESIKIRFRPKLAFRDYHSLQCASGGIKDTFAAEVENNIISVNNLDNEIGISMGFSSGRFVRDKHWYYNETYFIEEERGLDCKEDIFGVGYVETILSREEKFSMAFGTKEEKITRKMISSASVNLRKFNQRKRSLLPYDGKAPLHDEHARLLLSADDFIVNRSSTKAKTIIAGYPWFTDWGRDTMISLPGLAIATGRVSDAKEILSTFNQYISRGMIPNMFPDGGENPTYNTVDATLWYVVALYKYFIATRDLKFIKKTFPKLEEIILAHIKGTRHGIGVDTDGLISASDKGLQLTWMDAKIDGNVITPRHGKPVEINALWINTLHIYHYIAQAIRKTPLQEAGSEKDIAKLKKRFEKTFWNNENNTLYDVVHNDFKDSSIRPNQIFAISLPFPILGKVKSKLLLKSVEKNLLTPYGLRTLHNSSPDYKPTFRGNQNQRDTAYHQGTVWPWLIGPYLLAYLSINGKTEKSTNYINEKLDILFQHIHSDGLGHISEVFDADPPHKSGGCFAQAWSIATILEVLNELY